MSKRKLAVMGSIFAVSDLLSGQSMAAGFVTLPTSGASAYVACRSGFGVGFENTFPPLADSACVAPNAVGVALSLNSSPETGFTLGTANSGVITAFAESLGTLSERVFRNAGAGQCIYAKQVVMANTGSHDFNPNKAGTNRMFVNDFAFGGYTGAVSAGYAKNAASQKSIYRIGRTFTSVQLKRVLNLEIAQPCPGWSGLPAVGGTPGTEINGVGLTSDCSVTPSVSQQQAPFSNSWIDFTGFTTAELLDYLVGTPPQPALVAYPSSPNMYIKQACTNTTTSPVANSLKLRQTGGGYVPWMVVTGTSRAPSTNIAP